MLEGAGVSLPNAVRNPGQADVAKGNTVTLQWGETQWIAPYPREFVGRYIETIDNIPV